MSHAHTHGSEARPEEGRSDRDSRNLLIALVLNIGITVAQIVGGLLSGSLSLLADAAHNGSDAASLGISYGARRIAKRQADPKRTFGYNRAETIGAMINLTTLFVIAVFLMYQAVRRIIDPPEIGGRVMLIVGAIAFIEDAVSTWLLFKGQQHSLNIRSAFIHMIGDTLATVGVIVGGLLILFYDIHWIDPAITGAIAVYILIHAYMEIRNAIRILMESAPEDVEFDRMVRAVEAIEGVQDLHHVHLWCLDEKRVALEAHVAVREQDLTAMEAIKRRIKETLKRDFGVEHATLEIERADQSEHNQSIIRERE